MTKKDKRIFQPLIITGAEIMAIIGIVGGMGPEATCDLYLKIIRNTPALKDQDHLRVIIDSNPKIPDRTAYILGKGEDPRPFLIETARNVERAGASFIAFPCNTAHYFYDELIETVDVPIINMIDEVGRYILGKYGKCKVGLLATTGTYKGRVYEKYLNPLGIDIIVPKDEIKNKILDLIYKIKAGRKEFETEELYNILSEFKEKGINTVILGCTELPLVFNSNLYEFKDFNFISSTDILANKAVKIAKN
jgi:aspartate racemase